MTSVHKDIYVCSTVRHLLLSLYKAQDEGNQSTIIYFYDFQGVDPKRIDVTQLPSHINLVLMNREELVNCIKDTGLIGRSILFSSMRGWRVPNFVKTILIDIIKKNNNNLDLSGHINKLFLFNDNNKMSRLFRLLTKSYSLIEDGMGNYVEHKIDSKSKKLLRFLLNQTPSYHVFGERKKCDSIYVIHPEKLPDSVKHKGERLILSRDKKNISYIHRCFKFDSTQSLDKDKLIIATQPIFNKLKGKLASNDFFYDIYDLIISKSRENGLEPILKLHPKEEIDDYSALKEKGVTFLSNKLPMELYLLSSIDKINIISINSSAGIGMEDYCNIYKLIPDNDIHNFVKILVSLEKNKDSLEELISLRLSSIN